MVHEGGHGEVHGEEAHVEGHAESCGLAAHVREPLSEGVGGHEMGEGGCEGPQRGSGMPHHVATRSCGSYPPQDCVSKMLDWAVLQEAASGTVVCALSQGSDSDTLVPPGHSLQVRVEAGPGDHEERYPSSHGVMGHAGHGGRLPCGLSCLQLGWYH